jgi:hypothetical protein
MKVYDADKGPAISRSWWHWRVMLLTEDVKDNEFIWLGYFWQRITEKLWWQAEWKGTRATTFPIRIR